MNTSQGAGKLGHMTGIFVLGIFPVFCPPEDVQPGCDDAYPGLGLTCISLYYVPIDTVHHLQWQHSHIPVAFMQPQFLNTIVYSFSYMQNKFSGWFPSPKRLPM